MAWWKDPRIEINQSHSFWNKQNNDAISLNGKFVDDCLWTPKLTFYGLDSLSSWKPSAELSEGSPLSFYLYSNGLVAETLEKIKLSIDCDMDFEHYPFDVQV